MILQELFEGRMKDIDIAYQDFLNSRGKKAMSDSEFERQYGMTRINWAKRNNQWIQNKERSPVAPDAHLFNENIQEDSRRFKGPHGVVNIDQSKPGVTKVTRHSDVGAKSFSNKDYGPPSGIGVGSGSGVSSTKGSRRTYPRFNVDGPEFNESMAEAGRVARKPGQPANSKKHSDLYTDENPKGTITGLKFATEEDARASVTKIRNSGRSHAHKIQAAVAMEQRARAAGKASAAAVYRKYINSVKKTDEQISEGIPFDQCPRCGGAIVHESLLNEKQDACYHKVKSRYKVWPSAYASGALVQCRKKGAANWGTGGKKK